MYAIQYLFSLLQAGFRKIGVILVASLSIASLFGCSLSDARVKFTGTSQNLVEIVSGQGLSNVDETLGKTPIVISKSKVEGKIIRVRAEDKSPIYLVFPESPGNLSEFDIDIPNQSCLPGKPSNKPFRLVLKAYKAILEKRFSEAETNIKKLKLIDSDLAIGHLLKGLMFLESGDNTKAYQSFVEAKRLDASDNDIDKLITLSKAHDR